MDIANIASHIIRRCDKTKRGRCCCFDKLEDSFNKRMDKVSDIVYCSNCNYAMDKAVLEQAKLDFGCPKCGNKLSRFYSIGSVVHEQKLEELKRMVRENRYGNVTFADPVLLPPPLASNIIRK